MKETPYVFGVGVLEVYIMNPVSPDRLDPDVVEFIECLLQFLRVRRCEAGLSWYSEELHCRRRCWDNVRSEGGLSRVWRGRKMIRERNLMEGQSAQYCSRKPSPNPAVVNKVGKEIL